MNPQNVRIWLLHGRAARVQLKRRELGNGEAICDELLNAFVSIEGTEIPSE